MYDAGEYPEEDRHPRPKRRNLLLLVVGGCILVGGIIALLGTQVTYHPTSVGQSATMGSTATSGPKSGVGDPPIYWQTIEQDIAQGLYLTVTQVKAQLQPPAGQRDSPGIAFVATHQGVDPAQLRTIEIAAIQAGHDLLVQMGILTQAGSDQGMQTIRNWDDATLNDHVTGWFLNN